MAENLTTDDINPIPYDEMPDPAPTGIFFVKKDALNGDDPVDPIYWTDFSGMTVGEVPTGMTKRGDLSGDFLVIEDALALGGHVMQCINGPTDQDLTMGITVDQFNSMDGRENAEVLMKVRRVGGRTSAIASTLHRGSFNSGIPTGYGGFATGASNGAPRLILLNNSVSPTTLDEGGSVDFSTGTWWWVRSQVRGNDLKVKMWEDGTTEPSAWLSEVTDTTVQAPGLLGILKQGENELLVDVLSIAVGSDIEAPMTNPNT